MRTLFKKMSVVGMLAMMMAVTGCGTRVNLSLSGMMNNQTKSPVYLWVGEKSMPEAADLVAPGQSHQFSVTMNGSELNGRKRFSDQIKVHSSSDLTSSPTTQKLQMDQDYVDGKSVTIHWNDTGFTLEY